MSTQPMRGVFPILVTPFDAQDRVDEESLRRLVDYDIEAGVHGLGIAFGSEIPKLTEAERLLVTRVAVEQARGRLPIVVNSGAGSTVAAALYSRQAEDAGASAVMSLPPGGVPADQTIAYFRAISDAVHVPVWVQEASAAIGGAMIRQVAEACQRVRYAKVESAPPAQKVQEAVEHGAGLVAVFGGAGGTYFIEELRRGSQGTMPWPDRPHSFVRVWDHWQAGRHEEARLAWEQELAPILRIPGLVHKEILYRQGIIATPNWRAPRPAPMDQTTRREFDEVCERLGIG
ncbi:MAG: dihydrodipicolinate synthase family protein [Candidatus Latescibacterota bacterium]